MTKAALSGQTVALVSLGCAKNLVDSERILGSLLSGDFSLVSDCEDADVVVVNTCGFIESAKQESIDTILDLADQKPEGQTLVVAGCLSQRYAQELRSEIPEIDVMLGIDADDTIAEVLGSSQQADLVQKPSKVYGAERPRYLLTPPHSAYLRIADGCSQSCAFCAIPRIRGGQRSRQLEDVIREAHVLVERGAKEINLLSHDLTSFGAEKGGQHLLGQLFEALDQIEDLHWIRPLYVYPSTLGPDILDAFQNCDKVLPYIDLPLQHIADPMLKAMRRKTSQAHILSLLDELKTRVPNLVLRSTFLTGFPGETETDFKELLDFVKQGPVVRGGVFPYSDEEGTTAFKYEDKLPSELISERAELLSAALLQRVEAFNRDREGQVTEVLVDEISPDGLIRGRSLAEAPDADGVIFLDRADHSGQMLKARCGTIDGPDQQAQVL